MTPAGAGTLAVLTVDAVVLAAVELLFLPLHVGATPAPVSVLVAAVTTPWLVSVAASSPATRPFAAVPLVAWGLAVLAFGLLGPGGDVLLPADWRSLALVAGGALPAAVVLGRAPLRPVPDPVGA